MADNEEPAINYLRREDRLHGGWPFHYVHVDHTQLDCVVDIEIENGTIEQIRPWLTIAIEAQSRPVVAFYLSCHPPSAISCMMVMRDMVRRHRRRPDMLIFDYGKEFTSDAFKRLMKKLRMDFRQRPPHKARYGSVCERMFGTTNTKLIHNLLGNTKALQHVRTVTKSVDPWRGDHLSFAVLHGLLEYFFFSEYNNTEHPARGLTPNRSMELQFRKLGFRNKTFVPYDHRLYIATCIPPFERGPTRKIHKKDGILANYTYYWSEEFSNPAWHNKNVEVLIDMWNPAVAWADLDGTWVPCVSRFLMQFPRLTSVELKYLIYKTWRNVKTWTDYDEFKKQFEDAVDDVGSLSAAAAATAATRPIYEAAGLTLSRFSNDACQIDLPFSVRFPRRQHQSAPSTVREETQPQSSSDFDYDELPLLQPISRDEPL